MKIYRNSLYRLYGRPPPGRTHVDDIAGYIVEGHDEEIVKTNHFEAIEMCLDGFFEPDWTGKELKVKQPVQMPKTLTVDTYRRMDAASYIKRLNPLEDVLMNADENFGSEDGSDGWHTRQEMREMEEAERIFLARIARIYRSWMCEPIPELRETVDVEQWIKDECPEWLEKHTFKFGFGVGDEDT